ncbi:hypothetical protein PUN28_006015 [Cardiocondyla obscurior]|uniref:Uncharacterized protein n=1 Tax=Cardiocondyla obscurior TaxID=286306 RepID=A0AAW2GC39_9HYME
MKARGITLESVWTPGSWPSPPSSIRDAPRRDIWIPAMGYNASVVHLPRERERFRMSGSRDVPDTEMPFRERVGLAEETKVLQPRYLQWSPRLRDTPEPLSNVNWHRESRYNINNYVNVEKGDIKSLSRSSRDIKCLESGKRDFFRVFHTKYRPINRSIFALGSLEAHRFSASRRYVVIESRSYQSASQPRFQQKGKRKAAYSDCVSLNKRGIHSEWASLSRGSREYRTPSRSPASRKSFYVRAHLRTFTRSIDVNEKY